MSATIPWPGPARSGLACCLLLAFVVLEGCGSGSTPGNLSPVASNSCTLATGINQTFTGTGVLSLSAMDPEGQPLSYEIVTSPATGALTLTNPLTGEFSFVPAFNNRSTITFTYRACKAAPSTVCSNVATYTIVHTPRIMPLGDSITDGATNGGPIVPERVGYRKPLKEALTTAGYVTDFVGTLNSGDDLFDDTEHDGHGGCTADNLLNATGFCAGQGTLSSWLNTARPDVVLLHIGTNDISTSAGYSVTDVNDVEAILDTIDTWEAANWPVTVVLSKIITNRNFTTATTTFNNAVIAMAETRTTDILEWVDHQTNVIVPVDYGDQLHPNDLGYGKMTNVWLWPLTGTLGTVSGNHSGPGILPKCP